MARVICNASGVAPTPPDDFTILLQTIYVSDDAANGDSVEVRVTVPADADGDAIRAAMVDAVLADAADRGYTLDAADLTLPVFQRG